MCAYSNVSDYGKQIWLNPSNTQTYSTINPQPTIISLGGGGGGSSCPTPSLTPEQLIFWYQEIKKLFDAAKEFDKNTGQPDCPDPEKEKWMKEVEERLSKLEICNSNKLSKMS